MNSGRRASLLASVLLAALLPSPLAWARDDIEERLKADYQDRVLTLRHFYKGSHLSFQSNGSLKGYAEQGPWTVDSQIEVKRIKLHGHVLQLEGRRVCLVFDSKGKPFRDVLASLAESQFPDRDRLESAFQAKNVDIEIALRSNNPGVNEVSSAMDAVFLKPEESMRDIVPGYWRDYFDKVDGQPPRSALYSSGPVYSVKTGEVSPPRATYSPNPDYSEEARMAKYHGTMIVSVVVDPYGSVRDLAIVSPLGLGLDERAVAVVGTWKFKPGTKDGEPVAVKVPVEVDFRLY